MKTVAPKRRGTGRHRGEGARTKALRAVVLKVLAEIEGSLTSRQAFYQAVSRGAVENNKAECRRVGRLVVAMRRDGSVPYERIVDRTRSKHLRPSWAGLEDILVAGASQLRLDYWRDATTFPMVACEKQALEGIFAEAVDEWGASLWVIRGFNSESFEYEWAEDIKEITATGRDVAIYYFGDWDPAGLAIEANSKRKLEGFGARFTWERAGLLQQDMAAFDLVPIPVKRTDPNAKRFLSQFEDRGAELDALHPDELRRRIAEVIEQHVDAERWRRVQRDEQLQRGTLRLIAGNVKGALKGAKAGA